MTSNNKQICLILGTALLAGTTSIAFADEDKTIDPGSVSISIEQAIEIAKQGSGAAIVSVELESEDGVVLWEIEMTNADNQEIEIGINANTGEIVTMEDND